MLIAKYKSTPLPNIKKKAITLFNASIRERDKDLPCISCGKYNQLQAGHFYSAGHHELLRFEQDNVHGQCIKCNCDLSGNLIKYREGLIKKIGIERVERLDTLAAMNKRNRGKVNDRFKLIEIIEKYK
jgi:hypothetical protein